MPEDTQRTLAVIVATDVVGYGRLDVPLNNAGGPNGQDRGQIEDVPLSACEAVMGINVRGVFLMTCAAVPHMKALGYGGVV